MRAIVLEISGSKNPSRSDPRPQDPRNAAYIGVEAESSNYALDKVYPKQTKFADLSMGKLEADITQRGKANLESVAQQPMKNPRRLNLYSRTTSTVLNRLALASSRNEAPTRISTVWPNSAINVDFSVAHDDSLASGTSVRVQPTIGIHSIEHLPMVLAMRDKNEIALADAAAISKAYTARHGQELSQKAFGFLTYIAYTLRQGDTSSKHADKPLFYRFYIDVLTRKSYSSMYKSSLKSQADRDAIKKIIDPRENDGRSFMSEILEYDKSKKIFPGGYITLQPTGTFKKKSGNEIFGSVVHAGSTIEEFLTSIVEPQHFKRETDLLSPPLGTSSNYGIGAFGAVDPKTGEGIYELRAQDDMPVLIATTALPTYSMLIYMRWSPFNPRLPPIEAPRCEAELRRPHETFKQLSKIYSAISLTSKNWDKNRSTNSSNQMDLLMIFESGFFPTLRDLPGT